jgi:cytoskeletal protein CcmA (bactofilin family)
MWFTSKKQPPIRSLVGEGTVVRGDLHFSDGLRIDGEVHGSVIATGEGPSLLVISEKARVHGKVKAGHVIITGTVHGPLQADEFLEMQPTARIVGDVHYEVLELHQGATIEGEMHTIKAEEAPALKLAASNAK